MKRRYLLVSSAQTIKHTMARDRRMLAGNAWASPAWHLAVSALQVQHHFHEVAAASHRQHTMFRYFNPHKYDSTVILRCFLR